MSDLLEKPGDEAMPRFPRHKSPSATFYHLTNRVGGKPTDFPFNKRRVARRFLHLFEFYLRLYFCRLASFQLMGNHYHSIVHFQEFRHLDRQELECKAKLRFGRRWQLRTRHWNSSRWRQESTRGAEIQSLFRVGFLPWFFWLR